MSKVKRASMGIILVCIIIVIGFIVWNGAFLASTYDSTVDRYDDEADIMSETEFNLIRSGILSASSHNMQPWKIQIVNQNTFTLYADMEKSLPIIDPLNVQLLMSQGTFIGSIKDVAKQIGAEIEIEYHDINMDEQSPKIATFTILDEGKSIVDSISSATSKSIIGKKNFDSSVYTQELNNLLDDFQVTWIEGNQISIFQNYLRKATRIESENKSAVEEMLTIFRFSKWEKNKYKYGLSLNTMKPALRVFVEPIIGLTAQWKSFGSSSITTFEQRLAKEESYLVLSKNNLEAIDYIKVGESLSMLEMSVDGFLVRPAAQLIQPLDGIKELRDDLMKNYSIDGEIIQIIGFTKNTNEYHEVVRHKVMDIIIK